MKTQDSKKLVLIGISRKGEKGFNVRLDKSLKSDEDLMEAKEVLFNKSSHLEAVSDILPVVK